jgi:hypothetical protein
MGKYRGRYVARATSGKVGLCENLTIYLPS